MKSIVFPWIALVILSLAPVRAAGKPNIVVILSDDAGYAEFSMQGSRTIPTPRIDSIARTGARFTNGYVSGTVCSPTRAGLLTGRYQQRFGHELNIPPAFSETNGLPLTETLLPAVLKDAGYRTIALGKWHLGYAAKFHPMERGFTDFHGFLQGARSYFPLEKPSPLNRLLEGREPVAKEKFEYLTDHLAARAAAEITGHKEGPFFIYLAFNATHGPAHATPEDLAKAGGNRIHAMTLALDRAVGTVLDALEKNDVAQNTLVFFLNDNGGATGHDNTPLRGHKGSSWEGGIRVPFAVRWPAGIPGGQTIEVPVIALDIFPTALAAAGIADRPGQPLDGVNLLPLLTGKSKARPHQTLHWKTASPWAVRDGDLKLVGGNKNQEGPELYDLAKDVSESDNLAARRPDDVKRLLALHEAWVETHRPTPWAKPAASSGSGGGNSGEKGKGKGKKDGAPRQPGAAQP